MSLRDGIPRTVPRRRRMNVHNYVAGGYVFSGAIRDRFICCCRPLRRLFHRFRRLASARVIRRGFLSESHALASDPSRFLRKPPPLIRRPSGISRVQDPRIGPRTIRIVRSRTTPRAVNPPKTVVAGESTNRPTGVTITTLKRNYETITIHALVGVYARAGLTADDCGIRHRKP